MNFSFRLILCVFIASHLPLAELSGQNNTDDKYTVVFYNVENLFDPSDDPEKNDEEFTPAGKNHWTISKLNKKVMMVYRAILAASEGKYPDIIGLAEIENLWVLEYLIKKTPLQEANYGIIHKESPDLRGIDVALLYRKKRVVPLDYDFLPVANKSQSGFSSRDILQFKAGLNGETLHFFVNHWPSRSGGYVETQGKRNFAASIVRKTIDSIQTKLPHGKILLMGDFNATPEEACFVKTLSATMQTNEKNPSQLINLSQFWKKRGIGTIRSKGQWEIFDQFICTYNLLYDNGITISPGETTICTAEFLLEPDTRYLGKKPFRTHLGPLYHGGVSDHLPISLVLRKRSD